MNDLARNAAASLRTTAADPALTDEATTLLQSVADYIEATFDYAEHPRILTPQALYAEIAYAYVAGYEHAAGKSPRLAGALGKAGLSL